MRAGQIPRRPRGLTHGHHDGEGGGGHDAGRKEGRRGGRESQVHQGGVEGQVRGEGLLRAPLPPP